MLDLKMEDGMVIVGLVGLGGVKSRGGTGCGRNVLLAAAKNEKRIRRRPTIPTAMSDTATSSSNMQTHFWVMVDLKIMSGEVDLRSAYGVVLRHFIHLFHSN